MERVLSPMSLPCIDQHTKSPYTVVSAILPNISSLLLFAKLGLLVCAIVCVLRAIAKLSEINYEAGK